MRWDRLTLDRLSPSRLWSELDEATRRLAAHSIYRDPRGRLEADGAIAAALRYREVAVRRLPVEERVNHLLRRVRPLDALASSLLLHLHLEQRRPLLAAFLDELGIPHQDGVIDESFEPRPVEVERLARAADALYGRFPAGEVDVYLASLLALEPHVWGNVAQVVRQRAQAG
jgi:hypothetical protein